MKILYLADQDLDNESGVSQKISMQSNQWTEEGHQVTILSLESLSFFSVDKQRLSTPLITIKRVKWKIFIHLLYSSWKLKSILKDVDFDIVYMRYRLYAPFLKAALKKHPQIVEINTDDINEYRFSSPLLYWYNKFFRTLFVRSADGFVCVSHELYSQFTPYNKPAVVIANGIKLEALSFELSTSTSRPSLVFIGSPNQQWHGVEKIIYMAQELSEFDFHIVGLDGFNTENLFYYGYLPTDDANVFVQKHDIGISTLALYEKKMSEASPLKTRQYLAQGLPVIYAYTDTDFEYENTFSLKLPNNPNNVLESTEKIREFVNTVYRDKTIRKQAREFAKNRLDVTVKEKKRLSFFGEFL